MSGQQVSKRQRRFRSRIALRIAPWLVGGMDEQTMRFYRQHFSPSGKPKKRFDKQHSAEEWMRSHGVPYRAYRCPVCRGWHLTSKVGKVG